MLKISLYFVIALCSFLTAAPSSAREIEVINRGAYNKILDYLLISPDDVSLYKKIFRSQQSGDLEGAGYLSSRLENNILLGHVLAEKYLSPQYHASYEELRYWLELYYDHPQAHRIFVLAGKKGGYAGLTLPQQKSSQGYIRGWSDSDLVGMSASDKRYLLKEVGKFRTALNRGKTKAARGVLEQARFRQLAPNKYWDEMAASLAMKYLVDNEWKLAWQWSTRASQRKTSAVAPWVAGLTAWQLKDYGSSARYFAQLANSKNEDEWMVAAGGYWAHRAYSRQNDSAAATKMLHQAARYKHTFYGMLAAVKLGHNIKYNWDSTAYLNNFDNMDYVYDLLASPAVRRAIILINAKQLQLAEDELRNAYGEMTPKQQEATIFIANQYKMHSLAIYACKQTQKTDLTRRYDLAAYPVPEWFSRGRWRVEKSLVLALARQESAFNAGAKSSAGARGLMQLMPNTAFHITKDRSLKTNSSRLLEADYNLELGERYVEYLLSKPFVDGNLFYMAVAYNAGPGNLVRWQKNVKYGDDALLFIEIIPSAETRIYIERVVANYWIYNSRFGLASPTLEEVAAGKWPVLPQR